MRVIQDLVKVFLIKLRGITRQAEISSQWFAGAGDR